MADQDLSSIVVAIKKQAVDGVPEAGAGAIGLELLPSQGFSPQTAQILTELLSRTRMSGRPRKGSEFFNWAGETELAVDGLREVIAACIGGVIIASQTLTEVELTSATISGGGTVITFAAGSVIAEGVVHGMMAKFAGMSVAGNNGKWFPILSISPNGRVLGIPEDILLDNAVDNAFSLVIAEAVYTPAQYVDAQWTVEHYLPKIDRTVRGANFRFNGLTLQIVADKMVKLGLALGGTVLNMLEPADSPNFTDPVFSQSESLVLLDGAVYFNGTKRVDLASFNFGLQSPVSGLPLISSRTSGDAYLGQFKADGQFTGKLTTGDDFDAYEAEDQVAIFLDMAEQSASDPYGAARIGCYLPNFGFGGWSVPAGGEGAAIQTVPMNGGRDKRGLALGYAPTTAVFSFCS